MLKSLKRFSRPLRHGLLARLSTWYYGHPSDKLIVIGVTGTKGKTTTINLIAEILEKSGRKTGFTSTANYGLGEDRFLNTFKMSTMPEYVLQKWLANMVKNGCTYAVLEMTSEGLAQNRHLGINFDVAVFTNLTPEHLESHGSFENYRAAKALLFKTIGNSQITPAKKEIYPSLKKTIVANLDDANGQYFLNFKADQHISYGVDSKDATITALQPAYTPSGVQFKIHETAFSLNLKGRFDVNNALAAIAAAQALGITLETCRQALEKVPVIPGRMETVQKDPFVVMVDYAHEPRGMGELYETVKAWPHGRIIHVLGPTGGGRDTSHKAKMGKFVAKNADIVIVTTDDPYDDDPAELAKLMADGAKEAGKVAGVNLFTELDRAKAIQKAVGMAQAKDLVLITGKGSEQKIVVARGKMIDWDDRSVTRQALTELKNS